MSKATSVNFDDDVLRIVIAYRNAHNLSTSRVVNEAVRVWWEHLDEKEKQIVLQWGRLDEDSTSDSHK